MENKEQLQTAWLQIVTTCDLANKNFQFSMEQSHALYESVKQIENALNLLTDDNSRIPAGTPGEKSGV